MKKRLLIFHPTIAPYRVDLFNELIKRFECRICVSSKFHDFRDPSEIDKLMNFSPVYLKHKKSDLYHSPATEYWRQLKEFNPDVVITCEFNTSTISALIYRRVHKKKYKVVSFCDDSFDMISNNNDFSFKHRVARRLITPFIDNLILVEPNVVNWYRQHYHKGIWFPIIRDDDKARKNYERLLPQSQRIIDEYHLAGKHVFLFVGRLVALKNVRIIINAYKLLQSSNNVLVIIGSGEEEQNLHKEAAGFNNIIFTGRLEGDELYKWYNVATSFILASYLEAFGAVTNEALLAGCWAIISNKAGSQCLVKPKENGEVFNPHDELDLAKKMANAIEKLPCVPNTIFLRNNGMNFKYHQMISNLFEMLEGLYSDFN